MKKLNQFYLALLGMALFTLGACTDTDDTDIIPTPIVENAGYFILSEGANAQNSTLGFYNVTDGSYDNNAYTDLGSGGNDLITYGTKLYISVTDANKVVILDSETKEEIETLTISLPRRLLSYRGKVYVTSQGENQLVAIDTTSFATTSTPVGNSPEQLTAIDGKIYVANSGWREKMNGEDYDNTISVVDANSFSLTNSITVADNLVAIAADSVRNTLYVNANSTYEGSTETNPSKLYVINLSNNQITPMTFGAEEIVVIPSSSISQAFLISHNYGNNTTGNGQLLIMDTSNQTVQAFGQSSASIQNAYSIRLLPQLGAIAIGDAKDYTSNGLMHLFGYSDGTWIYGGQLEVGVSPKAFAYYYPQAQ